MRLIILQWLPGSWKSTYARELLATNPNYYMRVNREDIWLMLWWADLKSIVKQSSLSIIKAWLEKSRAVIVDDTNLSQATIDGLKDIAVSMGIQAEMLVLHPGLEECLSRNSKRENPVPPKAIRGMYERSKHILEDTSLHAKPVSEFSWGSVISYSFN